MNVCVLTLFGWDIARFVVLTLRSNGVWMHSVVEGVRLSLGKHRSGI